MKTTAIVLLLLASSTQANDPTRPPTPAEVDAWFHGGTVAENDIRTDFQLQSILLSPQRRVAVINGRRVTVGDHVDGAEVRAIDAGRVELEQDNESVILTIATRSLGETVRE